MGHSLHIYCHFYYCFFLHLNFIEVHKVVSHNFFLLKKINLNWMRFLLEQSCELQIKRRQSERSREFFWKVFFVETGFAEANCDCGVIKRELSEGMQLFKAFILQIVASAQLWGSGLAIKGHKIEKKLMGTSFLHLKYLKKGKFSLRLLNPLKRM